MLKSRRLPRAIRDAQIFLAAKLQQRSDGTTPPVITVTSRASGEGVTTIAVALADAFAMQNNCRVLLVDLAPSARRRLQLAPPSKAVQPAPFPLLLAADDRVYGRPENYNFDVLSVKNGYRPQEANLQECIPNCRLIYDVIIIDAGPLEDGMPFRLRHLSSATLLVIDARKTTLPMLQQLKKFMQAAEFKIDGVILNRRKFYIPSLLYGLVR